MEWCQVRVRDNPDARVFALRQNRLILPVVLMLLSRTLNMSKRASR